MYLKLMRDTYKNQE